MIFLKQDDFKYATGPAILQQLIAQSGGSSYILDVVEGKAIAVITDRLGGMYDITAELAKSGIQRNNALVMYMIAIAVYELYRVIPDDQVPPRVIKDYDDTMSNIESIGRGKMPSSLTPINDTDGNAKRVFRMRTETPRNHNMLS